MSFKTLHQVLGSFEHHDGWKDRRHFQQLLACWAEVVGPAVAAQTRPIAIQRQVLQVAAASSVWAQTLAFERIRILEKLNQRLDLGLTDIRFSTAQWRSDFSSAASSPVSSEPARLWHNHPSRLSLSNPLPPRPPTPTDPQAAFRHWARTMRLRSQHLPLCPACHSPTPEGELIRWSVCALCAAQQFGQPSTSSSPAPAALPAPPAPPAPPSSPTP